MNLSQLFNINVSYDYYSYAYILGLALLILYLSTKHNYIEYFDGSLDVDVPLNNLENWGNPSDFGQNQPLDPNKVKKEIRESDKLAAKKRYIEYKQQIYTQLLKTTGEVLDELDIPWFLSSGTCLGYFREDKFIDHDYDVDIGIFEKDYTPHIIGKMRERGLDLYRILGNRQDGMELSFRKKGTRLGRFAKIDIFLHYSEKDREDHDKEYYCWYSYKYPQFVEKVKYRVRKFELTPVEFMGLTVNVPHPTLDYILDHYGKDWLTPRRAGVDYFYATSPKSVVK